MKWLILIFVYPTIYCDDDSLEIISKTRTSYLQKYEAYVDVVAVHVEIPRETAFASLKLVADETKASMFSCTPRKVLLHAKHNTLPVINPDKSAFPSSFKNITRSELYYVELMSDKSAKYLNLTSPDPGCYFLVAYLPYSDRKNDKIQPPGLSAECYAYVEVTLYVQKRPSLEQIASGVPYHLTSSANSSTLYSFFVPKFVTHARVAISDVNFPTASSRLTVRVQSRSIPSAKSAIKEETIESNNSLTIAFATREDEWHYLEFVCERAISNITLNFTLVYFEKEHEPNDTSTWRNFDSDQITNVIPYKQYDLVRESSTESFSYSYELRRKLTISSSLAVNLTSDEFAVLRFKLHQHTDIGGTLSFQLSFKPRVNRAKKVLESEPDGHQIIGCIRPEVPELPTWPNNCGNDRLAAPIVLNKTTDNSSMMIPYPEAGVWYATFKLFCGQCVPCSCPGNCQKQFEGCVEGCASTCGDKAACDNCSMSCKAEVVNKTGCGNCDCDGPCTRTKTACNSSVVFDISSVACVNDCGRNGRCMFMVCDGVVYATCICSNNYRGWDCSDGSMATPYLMVVVELLLLVLSNLMFLPTVYVAYRRKYYVEAIVYFSICFFSTFYHACDAGDNIISFCITRLASLQFADFYCALLAMWVTLIAMADLPSMWSTICHITGAIVLAFTTTVNKTGMWGFVFPIVTGLLILFLNWFLKWRKIRQLFINKRYLYIYLPVGIVVVSMGLVIFVFLETEANYKYLHSLWHAIMAVAAMILLPRPDTFQPETML